MSDVLVKGWCPTLTRPMETGDGLLVRLHIQYGILTAAKAHAVAAAANTFGNGHIDLTSRGNLQLRGVTKANYVALLAEITGAGFAEELRPQRVAHPHYLPPLGFLPVQADKGTVGLGLAYGRLEADMLHWLADSAAQYGNGTILLSAWRSLFLPAIAGSDAGSLMAEAKALGFITNAKDSRRVMHVCPGAPSCSSAKGETRQLASLIAKNMPELIASGKTVHVSGCSKGCASSAKSSIAIAARQGGYDVAFNATAGDTPMHEALSAEQVLDLVGAV